MNVLKIVTLFIFFVLTACGRNGTVEDEPQQYKLLEIVPSDISLTNSYSASIQGSQDIKIIPRVSGYLTDILIKEGSKVKKDQTLFIIDQIAYKAELEAAKANVAVCEANVATALLSFESKQALFDKMIISKFDLTAADNALKMARAQLEQANAQLLSAQNNLSFTVIKSPSDGVVGKLPYRKGDFVSPSLQDGLTVVAENSNMYVYFSMSERQILEMLHRYKDMETAIMEMPDVKLQLTDMSIYPKLGRIESISGIIDKVTGSVSIRAVFENTDGLLLSGGAGSVIVPYVQTGAIVIPQEATFEIQDKTYVFKVVDGIAQSVVVSVDKVNNGKEYIVTGGLGAGDVIIAEGAGLVQEGIKVNVSKN